MQLYFNIPGTWNKRMQLRMSGQPSLTLGPKPNDYTYGKVRCAFPLCLAVLLAGRGSL